MNVNRSANWIFVPFTENTKQKLRCLYSQPIKQRIMKLKKLKMEIDSKESYEEQSEQDKKILKMKSRKYNRLLVTIN